MTIEAPDSTELDALSDLLRSPGYALFQRRIEKELERRSRELEQPFDQVNTADCRGYIRALRVVLRIPEILQTEISDSLKQEK